MIKYGVIVKRSTYVWIDEVNIEKEEKTGVSYLVSDRTIKGSIICGRLRKPGDELGLAAFIANVFTSRKGGYPVIFGLHFELLKKTMPTALPSEELPRSETESETETESGGEAETTTATAEANTTETTTSNTETSTANEAAETTTTEATESTAEQNPSTTPMTENSPSANQESSSVSAFDIVYDAITSGKLEKTLASILSPTLASKLVELVAALDDERQSKCKDAPTPADVLLCMLDQVTDDDLKNVKLSKAMFRTLRNRISENMAKVNDLLLK